VRKRGKLLFPARHKVRHRTETKTCFWNCPPEATNNARPQRRARGGQPVTYRYSHAGLRIALTTLLFGSALLLVPLAPAEAAPHDRAPPAAALAKTTKVAEADPATTSSLAKSASDEEPACNRPRRRLWVEGEGWIVRRVSACH
jgi:hypothetical protein